MMKDEVHIRLDKKEPLVVGNEVFQSISSWDLTEKDIEIARVELGETDEERRTCLQQLKSKLSGEGMYRTDDAFLLRYLRVRKFDCDKAYQNIKLYYTSRNKSPDIFGNPSDLYSMKNFEIATYLPYADEEGRLLFFLDFGSWDPSELTVEEAVRPMIALSDLISMNPHCQVNGLVGIYDMKRFTTRHVAQLLKQNRLSRYINTGFHGLPWRIKKSILFNTSQISRFFYSIVKPVLSKKLTERVIFLGSDLSELHQHVNPALLPKKLCGTLEDDANGNRKFVLDNIPYLEYDRSFTGE